MCAQYVQRCENDPELSIDSLYGFLDGRVDKMSKEEKQKKIEGIQNKFQEMYDAIEDITKENDPTEDVAKEAPVDDDKKSEG